MAKQWISEDAKNVLRAIELVFTENTKAVLCVISVQRVSDGQPVSALALASPDPFRKDQTIIVPLAVIIEGNPFDQFNPPDPDSDGFIQPDEILDKEIIDD